MRSIAFRVPATVAAAALVLAACTPKVDLEAARASLRDADTQWSAAAAAKNVDGFVAAFAADARFLPPHSPTMSGADNLRKFAADLMANPGFALAWQPAVVEVSASGDVGYTLGTYELALSGPDGQPIADKGKYLTVWKKQPDGMWRVVADTFNTDLPPPGPSASASDPSAPATPGTPAG